MNRGDYITANDVKTLQTAITQEEKKRNIKLSQSGLYPNQSNVSGGGTKKWVKDELVPDNPLTGFGDNVQRGNLITGQDFALLRDSVNRLLSKTMDYNISDRVNFDTSTGAYIYATDMNSMQDHITNISKYCVCNNKEACGCKEACNSNCSCKSHCTCNSYDPCSCVTGYVPPCSCKSYTPCSCNSYSSCTCDGPCSCRSHCSKCGCNTYTSVISRTRSTYVSKNGYTSNISNFNTTISEFSQKSGKILDMTISWYMWFNNCITPLTSSVIDTYTYEYKADPTGRVFEPAAVIFNKNYLSGHSEMVYNFYFRYTNWGSPILFDSMYFSNRARVRGFYFKPPRHIFPISFEAGESLSINTQFFQITALPYVVYFKPVTSLIINSKTFRSYYSIDYNIQYN